MKALRLACIVEGHGDREALPVLLRRMAYDIDPNVLVDIPPPIRIPKHKLLRPNELERGVELAVRQAGRNGAVLLLVDSDDDCPAELAPRLRDRATQTHRKFPIAVVLPKREFEAWFLAAAESIRGKRGLSDQLTPPSKPENVRGAKEWLTRHMKPGRRYVETLDQPALSAIFDLSPARQADSFDKLYREMSQLVREVARTTPSLPG